MSTYGKRETLGLDRALIALALAAALFAASVAVAPPAHAATTTECISSVTKNSTVWSLGSVQRWTGGSTSSNLSFTFNQAIGCIRVLPGGSDTNFGMRAYFCGPGTYSSERVWLGSNVSGGPLYTNTPATDVLPGTCFQVSWRAKNAASANNAWKGRLTWQTS